MYPNQDAWGQPQGGPQGPGDGWGQPQGFGSPQQQWTPGAPMPGSAPQQLQRTIVPPDPDDLMTGGHKAAAFPDQQFGTVVGGPIVEKPRTEQQRDFDSGQPKFYDDGNPMWQIVVAVQTDQTGDDDDGIRAFYLKSQMKKAVQDAVRRAGAGRLDVGGVLQIRYLRDEPNSRGRGKPKKIYEARYQPPAGQTQSVGAAAPISGLPMNTPPRAAAALNDEVPF